MDIKKGNKGNKYLNLILEKLGPEYSSNEEDIVTNATHFFTLKHSRCNQEFKINWINAKVDGICTYCFCHGREHSNEYFEKLVFMRMERT